MMPLALFKLRLCDICDMIEMLPVLAVMTPLFSTLPAPDTILKLFIACKIGCEPVAPDGSAFVIDPPAFKARLPALLIVPALEMFWVAFKVRFVIGIKGAGETPAVPGPANEFVVIGLPALPGAPPAGNILVIKPPDRFEMLSALIVALLIDGLVDTAYIDPAFVRLPLMLKVDEVENLSIAVTPCGIIRSEMREASVELMVTEPPIALPPAPMTIDWCPLLCSDCITATTCAGVRVLAAVID